jgi:hypothetical protein
MKREYLKRGYSGANFGGFSDVDGTVAFLPWCSPPRIPTAKNAAAAKHRHGVAL